MKAPLLAALLSVPAFAQGTGAAQPGGSAVPERIGPADSGPTADAELDALLGEAVVTTASRSAERSSAAPSSVVSITGADLLHAGMRTVGEAIEFLSGGVVVNSYRTYASGGDVGAQGILLQDSGRHVLVLLDGVVLNAQSTGRSSVNEAIGVPLDAIDHIELMVGPGSVMYGSNAMLAVINVVTRRGAEVLPFVSVELGGSPGQDIAGNPTLDQAPGYRLRLGAGVGTKFSLFGATGDLAVFGEWVSEQSNEVVLPTVFTTGGAAQASIPSGGSWGGPTSTRMAAPSVAITMELAGVRLLLSAFDYTGTMPTIGIFNDPKSRERQTGVRLNAQHSVDLNSNLTLATRVYAGGHHLSETSSWAESFWCMPGQDNGCTFELAVTSGWAGLEQQLATDWFLDGSMTTTVGYDLRPRYFDTKPATYADLVDGSQSEEVPSPHEEGATIMAALFAQHVWRPSEVFNANIGARLDYDSIGGAHVSPRAALVVRPFDATTVRLAYNEAFRAPSAFEIYEIDPTFRIAPTGLTAETVRSFEVEVQQRIDRLQLSLRGFAAAYDDFIDSRGATPKEIQPFLDDLSPTADPAFVIVNDNLASRQAVGAAVSAHLTLTDEVRIHSTFSIAPTFEEFSDPVHVMPLWYGSSQVAWRQPGAGFGASLAILYNAPRSVSDSESPFDAGRLDLRAAADGPTGIGGLRWRTALAFAANPDEPFLLEAVGLGGETDVPIAQQRISAFVGLTWSFGGAN